MLDFAQIIPYSFNDTLVRETVDLVAFQRTFIDGVVSQSGLASRQRSRLAHSRKDRVSWGEKMMGLTKLRVE